jgi:hypothetical protein
MNDSLIGLNMEIYNDLTHRLPPSATLGEVNQA